MEALERRIENLEAMNRMLLKVLNLEHTGMQRRDGELIPTGSQRREDSEGCCRNCGAYSACDCG